MTGEPRKTVDLFEEHNRASNVLLRGYLRLYILEQLHRQPGTGAEMAETLHESCKWKPSPGTIYPLLRRLEREGLVESRWDTSSKPQRVYKLTEDGEEERVRLREQLEPQLRHTLRMLQIHIEYLFGEGRG
ncbi:MAG: PadR family transcriptional regulator [Chloroflexota bacterium]|jgi:DNA-binding PadR family transcriptional regulator